MKARTFAHINRFPLVVTHYWRFNLGSYWRREKSKRNYLSYFNFEKNIFSELIDRYNLFRRGSNMINEPDLKEVSRQNENECYRFSEMPHWDDYFVQLKDHRLLVIELFWSMLQEHVRSSLDRLEAPVIGVHVRMGDFRRLSPTEDFSRVGAVRTPEEYFVNAIQTIRKIHGTDLSVSVFTDGFSAELEFLLRLNNVRLVEGNRDIVDMLLLSKSKIIVTSAGSTFSYWAGFLSDAPIIMHPEHIHQPLRNTATTVYGYEGPLDENNRLLVDSIKAVK